MLKKPGGLNLSACCLPASGLSQIAEVKLVSPKDKNKRTVLQLVRLENGACVIGWNENLLPNGFKSGKLKLQVFLEGNETTTPNATLTVTVKLA